MSEKELKQLEKDLNTLKKKVASSVSESKKVLTDIGVFDKKGTLKKEYRFLCIPQNQD